MRLSKLPMGGGRRCAAELASLQYVLCGSALARRVGGAAGRAVPETFSAGDIQRQRRWIASPTNGSLARQRDRRGECAIDEPPRIVAIFSEL